MVTVLVTSFLLLVLISFAIYRWQRVPSNEIAKLPLPPPPNFDGLFADSVKEEQARLDSADLIQNLEERQQTLLLRAEKGDKVALLDGYQTGDQQLYDDILNTLVSRAENDKQVFAIASFVSRNEGLRINRALVNAFTNSWRRSQTRHTTAELLHLAALAGDTVLYRQTIELVTACWREKQLLDMTKEELVTLIEGEFWLIPSTERSSGGGFLLKRELAKIRHELLETRDE